MTVRTGHSELSDLDILNPAGDRATANVLRRRRPRRELNGRVLLEESRTTRGSLHVPCQRRLSGATQEGGYQRPKIAILLGSRVENSGPKKTV